MSKAKSDFPKAEKPSEEVVQASLKKNQTVSETKTGSDAKLTAPEPSSLQQPTHTNSKPILEKKLSQMSVSDPIDSVNSVGSSDSDQRAESEMITE